MWPQWSRRFVPWCTPLKINGLDWVECSVYHFQNSFQKTTNKRNSLSFDRMSIRSQRAKIRSRVERRGVSSREHSPILWGRPVSSLSDTCFHFLLLSPHNFLMDSVHWSHLWFLGPEGFPSQSKCWVNTWMNGQQKPIKDAHYQNYHSALSWGL